jgi:hypothetical protein
MSLLPSVFDIGHRNHTVGRVVKIDKFGGIEREKKEEMPVKGWHFL